MIDFELDCSVRICILFFICGGGELEEGVIWGRVCGGFYCSILLGFFQCDIQCV